MKNYDENPSTARNPPVAADDGGAGAGQHAPQSRYFRAVVQAREPGQMEVLRWLASDDMYEMCYILHDRDLRETDADSEDTDENTDEVGKDGKILPHYHILFRAPKKCTARTMTKRFGGYVHFQIAQDPFDYSRYLTHECFRARKKFQYSRDDIQGDRVFYEEMLGESEENPTQVCKRWRAYIEMSKKDGAQDLSGALDCAIQYGDKRVIKSIMSHSYFFDKYFK